MESAAAPAFADSTSAAKQLTLTDSDSLMVQISELKEIISRRVKELPAHFPHGSHIHQHAHLHMALSILRKAELLVRSRRPKKRAEAWYELKKAELLFYHQDSFCLDGAFKEQAEQALPAGMGSTPLQSNGGAAEKPEAKTRPERETDRLRRGVDWMWHEVMLTQHQYPKINMSNVADWLKWGEASLNKKEPDILHAKCCLMRARASLAKAQECAEWERWGALAIFIELLYLFLVPFIVVVLARQVSEDSVRAVGNFITALHVPRYAFFWGFLGGISWCLYNATYWTKRRLFDRHYLTWYMVHPWMSAVLGGVACLLFIGGLSSLTKSDFKFDSDVSSALLSLVSFFAGFSTHSFLRLLDRVVSKLFNSKASERSLHERSQKEVHRASAD